MLYINGQDMSQLGIMVKKDYSVGHGTIDRTIYARLGGTGYTASSFRPGLRSISLPLRVVRSTTEDADASISRLLRLCSSEKVELLLPNGKHYAACMKAAGDTKKKHEGILDILLTFAGYQHDDLVHTVGTTVYCYGTMPDTPAKFSSAVVTAGSFAICGVTFTGCAAGDTVALDGINCRVLYNNAPCDLSNCNIVDFPKLQPGVNTLSCDGVLTTDYYPMYL